MAEEQKPDAQLFQLLTNLLQENFRQNSIHLNILISLFATIQFIGFTNDVKYAMLNALYTLINACLKPVNLQPIQPVESLTNQEEVELRAKIKALGLEVTKLPPKPSESLDELEIAKELDKLSAKLDDVDEMISSAMAANPDVQSLLSSTADVWMPIITASSEERRNFAGAIDAGSSEEKQDPSE